MVGQTKSFICLILASFLEMYNSYSVVVPHFKGDGNRNPKGLFKASDIFFNDTAGNGTNDFLVNTPGCFIPDYTKSYRYKYTLYRGNTNFEHPCGVRVVNVYNLGNNKIRFGINSKALLHATNSTRYNCCYKFAYKTAAFPGYGTHIKLVFTKCTPFRNGTITTLQYEIIEVTCITKQKRIIYTDAYIGVKKIEARRKHKSAWNVLLIGMDSMSRARLFGTMPVTSNYLQFHKWLDYRGYQKVDFGTFPNLMSLMTGMNSSRIYTKCEFGMYKCADEFIWNHFKKAGYVTAYGEDFLALPDTFSQHDGFRERPTDHYMRPFYLLGESRNIDIMCTKTKPSATYLLNYARNFAKTYKHNNFFGLFWINSYSHGFNDNPSKLDKEMTTWFEKLYSEGILKNTFVVFFSANGIKYGSMKFPIESYYDERLPILYMWVPHSFRKHQVQKYTNMLLNQHRLITPYNLYATFGDVLKLADNSSADIKSEACPQCLGLFKLNSVFRTCADVKVSHTWCGCRTMYPVKDSTKETMFTAHVVLNYINNLTANAMTYQCYKCNPLTLLRVIRSHAFQSGTMIFNVIAFQLSNEMSFEATVAYSGDSSKVTALRPITNANKRGICVQNENLRAYCDCIMFCTKPVI